MCFAILKVSYRNDKAKVDVDCDSAKHMQSKIAELQKMPEVTKIGVFICQQHVERVEEWRASPYTAPPEE